MTNNTPNPDTLAAALAALRAGAVFAQYPRAAQALKNAAARSPSQLAAEASNINLRIARDLSDADLGGDTLPDHQRAGNLLSALVREIVL